MNLVIDLGNTMIKFGLFEQERLIKTFLVNTDRNKSEDEYSIIIRSLIGDELKIEGAIISSVVPALTLNITNAIKKLWDMGISIVVLKSIERKGYYTGYNGNIVFTEFYSSDYIDTTCSGDVFNGGFLHAYTHGFTPLEATKFASILAGLQAQGIGAIKSIPYKEEVYSVYRGNNG